MTARKRALWHLRNAVIRAERREETELAAELLAVLHRELRIEACSGCRYAPHEYLEAPPSPPVPKLVSPGAVLGALHDELDTLRACIAADHAGSAAGALEEIARTVTDAAHAWGVTLHFTESPPCGR